MIFGFLFRRGQKHISMDDGADLTGSDGVSPSFRTPDGVVYMPQPLRNNSTPYRSQQFETKRQQQNGWPYMDRLGRVTKGSTLFSCLMLVSLVLGQHIFPRRMKVLNFIP